MNTLAFLVLAVTPTGEPASTTHDRIQLANVAAGNVGDVRDYAACMAVVELGGTAYLCVSGYPTRDTDYSTVEVWADGKKLPSGYYKCWFDENKGPQMQRVNQKTLEPIPVEQNTPVAQEVRPLKTIFRSSTTDFLGVTVRADRVKNGGANPVVAGDKSHFCPTCGAGEWRLIETFNSNGTHNHRCGNCDTAFTH